jgi:hypothetical protein
MKKMNLIALMLASMILFSVKTSVAQNTTFKLSDYKNPDYLYQSMDLNFGLNNSLYGFNDKGNAENSYNSFSLNSQAGAVYERYLNSPKAQGDLRISFNAGIGSGTNNAKYSSNAYDEIKNKSFNHNERLDISGLHRFYNQKNNFIEVNGSIVLNNQGNNSNDKSSFAGTVIRSEERSQKYFQNGVNGTFLIGKGRIEQVQDARMALYLLDDLYKLNREKRVVSDEDVNDLAQLITRLKYKRFFDDRLRKIAEITAIDSLMQQKEIISAADATYFTSLNDNWEYANNPIRDNGHRLFTGLKSYFGYTRNNAFVNKIIPEDLTGEETATNKNVGLFLVLGYAYEKPASLKWQNSASIKGEIGIHQHFENKTVKNEPDSETETKSYSESAPSMNLYGEYGFGYYPTSRTWLTFRWWVSTGWDKKMEGDTKKEKENIENDFYIYTGPQLNAFYYLSEKLRLSFSYNGSFAFNNYKYTSDIPDGLVDKATRSVWNQSVNAALTYSLF